MGIAEIQARSAHRAVRTYTAYMVEGSYAKLAKRLGISTSYVKVLVEKGQRICNPLHPMDHPQLPKHQLELLLPLLPFLKEISSDEDC